MAELTKIEGISEAYSEKLAIAGIGSTTSLLDKGSTRAGRKEIAVTTGVKESHILEWVNRADLFRVRGIGEEYSDLLAACGVNSVPELAVRNAVNLSRKMEDVNSDRSLVRRVPVVSEVERWIDEAGQLPRKVNY